MPWLNKVGAVVEGWYPGQESGSAIASILFGDVNPSGHLPVSFPQSDSDTSIADAKCSPGVDDVADYSENLLVGYRWYNATKREPLFPFGFGLSYTKFELAEPTVSCSSQLRCEFTVHLTNTGKKSGSEIVQMYLTFPESAGEPPQQLKGFQKVTLDAGKSTNVKFALDRGSAQVWMQVVTNGRMLQALTALHLDLLPRL